MLGLNVGALEFGDLVGDLEGVFDGRREVGYKDGVFVGYQVGL